MPNVPRPAADYLLDYLKNLDRRIGAVAAQQNWGITDGNGIRRILCGLQDDLSYGLRVFDNAGNSRVDVGQLPNGDYGLLVTDAAGTTTTEILPVYEHQVIANEGTSSTTYTDLATPGPVVDAVIGQNNSALITINSYVGIPGSSGGAESAGWVGVEIDNTGPAIPLDGAIFFSNTVVGPDPVGMAASQSTQIVLTGLTAGPHTFKMVYKMMGPGPANFQNRFLQVHPL